MNVHLGDLDFFEVTYEMSEIVGKQIRLERKLPICWADLITWVEPARVKNIFRSIVAASSHDRKGRRNVAGPEGYVDVPDVVVSRNKHGCIPDGSIW